MSTSAKSKKESKAIDRPFDPKILKKAKETASDYQMVIWFEDGEFYGRGLELPLVMSGGKTADECVRNTREALAVAVAYLLEEGERPTSSSVGRITLRPTQHPPHRLREALLEQAAQRSGFRGVSDYVRHAALTHGDN